MSDKIHTIDKKRILTLTITERCNLNCIYCYEHEKSSAQMSFETAKTIIDSELKNLDKYEYQIDFFGGEPFENFELMEQIVDYTLNNYRGYYHFFVTTNGTLVHDRIKKWLIKHKNEVSVGLSFDGIKEAQDINRSNSFDQIDLDFFLKYYPEQPIKMTISEQSLPYLADSIKFLTEKGFTITCNLAYMVDWLSDNNASVLQKQLNALIDYYIKNPEEKKCSMFDFRLELLSHPEPNEETYRKYCGCGTHMACYDKNGNKYPCQLFSPLSAGDKAVLSSDFKVGTKIEKNALPDKCAKCYYLRICQICLGSNYLSTGNIYKIDEERCKLYKIIYKANAKLKALEWNNKTLKTEDEQGLLRAIINIQNL